MTLRERVQCKQLVSEAKHKEREEGRGIDPPGTGSSLGNENHKVKKTTLNTFALKKDENIEVIYTNDDSLPNKINELKLVLNSHDIKLGMLNSNFFQNRNSNPKNPLKFETRFLLYPIA